MNNGVPNFILGSRKLWSKRRTPPSIYEIIDAERRILFLLCLKQANDLPQLPLELVVDILKRITKPAYVCFICGKFVEKGRKFCFGLCFGAT
jgi:hypothetical protein